MLFDIILTYINQFWGCNQTLGSPTPFSITGTQFNEFVEFDSVLCCLWQSHWTPQQTSRLHNISNPKMRVPIWLVNRIYETHLIGWWSLNGSGSGSGSQIWTSKLWDLAIVYKLVMSCLCINNSLIFELFSLSICHVHFVFDILQVGSLFLIGQLLFCGR